MTGKQEIELDEFFGYEEGTIREVTDIVDHRDKKVLLLEKLWELQDKKDKDGD